MKMKELKEGVMLVPDKGFTCILKDRPKQVLTDGEGEFYVLCKEGRHYLEGQRGKAEELVGFRLAD